MINKLLKGNILIKKIIYFVWWVAKKIAYQFNIFDHKVSEKIVKFSLEEVSLRLKNKRAAIVLHTFDWYEFLWRWFVHFFEKFRKNDEGIIKYFLTEEKLTNFDGRISILSWNGERNQRLIKWLSLIEEDYIIYMQEDFWVYKDVDSKIMSEIINFCIKYDVKLLKIHDKWDEYMLEKTDKIIAWKHISRVNKNSEYLMSHAISIWNKQFLIEHLNIELKQSPWENEIQETLKMKFDKKLPLIFQYNMFSKDNRYDETCHSWYRAVCSRGEYNTEIREFIDMLINKVGN